MQHFKLFVVPCLFIFLLIGKSVWGIDHIYQAGNGKTFYLAAQHPLSMETRTTLIEVDFQVGGTITNPRVLDEHFNNDRIEYLVPYGQDKIAIFTRNKNSGKKKLFLKLGMSINSRIKDISGDIKEIFPADADFKDMAVIGDALFILTTQALFAKDLSSNNFDVEKIAFDSDWPNVTKIIGVGQYLVFHRNDGRLFSMDTQSPLWPNPRQIGSGWGKNVEMLALDNHEVLIRSPKFDNLQKKFADSDKRNQDAGAYVPGMSVGKYNLYDHNGKLFVVEHPADAAQNLIIKQNTNFPRILKELQEKKKKTSHWIWWVFPNEVPGRSESLPKSSVSVDRVDFVLAHADMAAWSEILETIADLLEKNRLTSAPLKPNSAIIPSIDHGRIKHSLIFWLRTVATKTQGQNRFHDALKRLNNFTW